MPIILKSLVPKGFISRHNIRQNPDSQYNPNTNQNKIELPRSILFRELENKKKLVELDHDTKKVSLMGENFDSSKWKVIYDKEENDETIYNSVADAIREANQTIGGEYMIKEVQTKGSI